LQLRITLCSCVRSHCICCTSDLVIRSCFVWWIPQGRCPFLLCGNWIRARFCKAMYLLHEDNCFPMHSMQVLAINSANYN
jgi:hypothetical protein